MHQVLSAQRGDHIRYIMPRLQKNVGLRGQVFTGEVARPQNY